MNSEKWIWTPGLLDREDVAGVAFERVEGKCGGTWVLAGTRLMVETLHGLYTVGQSIETIQELYPYLTLEAVEASLALPSRLGSRWITGGSKPTFNHTRADGPFDPCPECLDKMGPKQLRELVADLREQIDDMNAYRVEDEPKHWKYDSMRYSDPRLELFLASGWEPFAVTAVDGWDYVHLRCCGD